MELHFPFLVLQRLGDWLVALLMVKKYFADLFKFICCYNFFNLYDGIGKSNFSDSKRSDLILQ